MPDNLLDAYYTALVDTDRDAARALIHAALDEGHSPESLVIDVLSPSLERFADDFVEGRKTLAQHFLSSTISGELVEELLGRFETTSESKGVVILGTAEGDFHGLGRKIVGGFLRSSLYTVVDLGINVSPDRFVSEAVKHEQAVIGISSMMVHTALGERGAKGVDIMLKEQGIRDRFRLLVGGAPYKFDDTLWQQTGADAWASDARFAAKSVDKLLGSGVRP